MPFSRRKFYWRGVVPSNFFKSTMMITGPVKTPLEPKSWWTQSVLTITLIDVRQKPTHSRLVQSYPTRTDLRFILKI